MYQGISDKKKFLIDYMKNSGMTKYCAGYIGDDLNDFEPMKVAGLVCCPGDACDEIKQISDYVASANGGYGAVRECITYLLKSRGEWETAIAAAYRLGYSGFLQAMRCFHGREWIGFGYCPCVQYRSVFAKMYREHHTAELRKN